MIACRRCGCDELHACPPELGGPCGWVGPDLCSVCADDLAEIAELLWACMVDAGVVGPDSTIVLAGTR
jgi:hypothetical protein